MKPILLTLSLVVFAACSSGEGSGGVSGGAAGTSSGGGGSGGGSSVTIPCGPGLTCSGGESCCASFASEAPMCATTCPQQFTQISCRGMPDCNGNACCGTPLFGIKCVTSTTCPSDEKQACLEASECPSNKCISGTLGGIEITSCVP
jgi:hypothetical protein